MGRRPHGRAHRAARRRAPRAPRALAARRRAPRAPRALAGAVALPGTLVLLACSGGGTSSSSTVALRTGGAETYLLRLDELSVAGFHTVAAPGTVTVATLVGGDQARLRLFAAARFEAAAQARYFRDVSSLSTENGPFDVITTVERFGDVGGASRAFLDQAQHDDSAPGGLPLSAGQLGDQSHAVLVTAVAPDGVTVEQTTVLWRVANLVSVLEVRARFAGSPLQDALDLARPQLLRQGGTVR